MRSNTLIPAIRALFAKNTCHTAVHLGTSVPYFMHMACCVLHTGIFPVINQLNVQNLVL